MTISLTEAAALSDWIYARSAADQGISLEDAGGFSEATAGFTSIRKDLLAQGLTFSETTNEFYGDGGFAGAIVRRGNEFVVVLRGTDIGGAGALTIG